MRERVRECVCERVCERECARESERKRETVLSPFVLVSSAIVTSKSQNHVSGCTRFKTIFPQNKFKTDPTF